MDIVVEECWVASELEDSTELHMNKRFKYQIMKDKEAVHG